MHTIAQSIRTKAWEDYVRPALARGDSRLTIVAGDIVRAMALINRTPTVCSALSSKIFQREYDLELESKSGPPSGNSTTMRFTYRLLGSTPGKEQISRLERLKGVGEVTYRQLGGGTAFIEEERTRFGKQ